MPSDTPLSFQDFLDETEPQRAHEETERLWAKLQELQAAQQLEQRERNAHKVRSETLASILSRISFHSVGILNEHHYPFDGRLRYNVLRLSSRFSLNEFRRFSYWRIGQNQTTDTFVLCSNGSFGVIVMRQHRRTALGQLNEQGTWRISRSFYDAQCQTLRCLLKSAQFTDIAKAVVGNSTRMEGFDEQFIRDVCSKDYVLLRYKFRPTRPDE